MALLLGRLCPALGARAAARGGARGSAAALFGCGPQADNGGAPRRYSSELKDELRVRYLDGEDSGRRDSDPDSDWFLHNFFCLLVLKILPTLLAFIESVQNQERGATNRDSNLSLAA